MKREARETMKERRKQNERNGGWEGGCKRVITKLGGAKGLLEEHQEFAF